MSNGTSSTQWVGVDLHLHLHRSVICRIDAQGRQLDWVRIDNDPKALVAAVRKAGRGASVAIEATYGWVRHEALHDRAGWKDPPAACRSRSLKLEAA